MAEGFFLEPLKMQALETARALRECNDFTAKYSLVLSPKQIDNLVERRFSALHNTDRVEFGEGILKKLIYAFCDSPFISQTDYEDTISELQDCFYYFKSECEDRLSDDELLEYMVRFWNGAAQGSLDYMSGTSLSDICRGECRG